MPLSFFKNVDFEAALCIDRHPFKLLVGAIGYQFAFIAEIDSNYILKVEPADKEFAMLRDILQTRGNLYRYLFSDLIKHLLNSIPMRPSNERIQPHEIAMLKIRLWKHIPDECNIYFQSWNDYIKDKKEAHNFNKTHDVLGEEVSKYCKTHNISSCWTDKPKNMQPYQPPQGFK